ncbi:MAG TPA: serine/threonine-protein kinase [Streptosporangiaceae bacterium]
MPELPLVGDEFAGYRLRAVLGRGGMSTVYQAENPRLGNVIALKVLAPELATDDVFRTRFLEESRIAAAMNHPHVIPIHDMGSTDGLLYIAMRCVSGTDLRQMISKRGRLLPDTAIFLLSQAARALDAAHRRGLVHRDVKPGNLLAERGNDDSDPDHLYLADFGITKPAIGRTGLTATGAFLGTIDYIAPEQIRGLSVLGMADQYSLGCVLYECLAGRVPFEKDLDAAIIWAHVEEPPTRLTLLRPDLPPAIDEVFDRVLAKQPGDRYENCREFMGAAWQALGLPDAPAATPPGGFSRRVLRPAPPAPDYQEVAHDPHDAHDVRTGLRVMSATVARPASLPRENLPSLPELAPVPEWSPPYLPSGPPPGGLTRLDGPAGPDDAGGSGGVDGSGGGGGVVVGSGGLDGSGGHGGSPAPAPAPALPARDRGGWRVPVLLLALAFVLTAGIGITLGSWLGFPGKAESGQQPGSGAAAAGSGSGSTAAGTAARAPATSATLTPPTLPATPPKTLSQALALVNTTVWTTGYLPQKSCTFVSAVSATCSSPYPGITMAFFQNYSSPDALYKAYEAAIKQANSGRLVINTQDCGASAPPATGAEISWNHFGLHTRDYSVQQLETGKLNAASQAAGRMFCNYDSSTNTESIIWTETDGNMLGEVTGSPHLAVWSWWLHVHHNIAFNGQPMGAMDMPPSAFPKA